MENLNISALCHGSTPPVPLLPRCNSKKVNRHQRPYRNNNAAYNNRRHPSRQNRPDVSAADTRNHHQQRRLPIHLVRCNKDDRSNRVQRTAQNGLTPFIP